MTTVAGGDVADTDGDLELALRMSVCSESVSYHC
jgi:hypothetical protein